MLEKSCLTDLLEQFLCARVLRRVLGGVFGCKSALVTLPWCPQVQQYQQALLQQQVLAQQRAQQVQSPEYITSPQDFAPALISYPRSLPVRVGTVADPPYPTNRWEFGAYSWLTLLIVVSTAKSFSWNLIALVVRDDLEQLDSGCSVVKYILGSKVRQFNRWAWYNFLKYLSSSISCSWAYSRNWLLTTWLGMVSSLCWMRLCASERSFKHPVESSFVVDLDVLRLPIPVLRGVTWVYNMTVCLSSGPGTCPSLTHGNKWWLPH